MAMGWVGVYGSSPTVTRKLSEGDDSFVRFSCAAVDELQSCATYTRQPAVMRKPPTSRSHNKFPQAASRVSRAACPPSSSSLST
jgi:hypothetical protein